MRAFPPGPWCVVAVPSSDFVLVLDRAGYPGQVRGMEVRLALRPDTRILDEDSLTTAAAITSAAKRPCSTRLSRWIHATILASPALRRLSSRPPNPGS